MRVKLVKEWMNHEPGRIFYLNEYMARRLISSGIAVLDDPELFKGLEFPRKDKMIRSPRRKKSGD